MADPLSNLICRIINQEKIPLSIFLLLWYIISFFDGSIPLFSTYSLISHSIIGTKRAMSNLRVAALFKLYSLIPRAVYLISRVLL
ncbi:GlpM family protein [Photobacterium salinisoli]|uniref:GlpM family protein n=1 Tax=Photobacterium salinisoli TaxID=1616783 RepID=UPI003B835A17